MNQHKRDPEPFGIVLIHGAAAVMEGHALVFLGPSGAGKSTVSKLLGPSMSVIGDDRLYLVPRGPHWFVADATTNRALKGSLTEREANNLVGTPLKVVLRIFQSSQIQLIPTSAIQTCRYLHSAFFELFWSRHFDMQTQKSIFGQIADISRKTLGFELHFKKSPEIAVEIQHTIGVRLSTK